jgi:hypothetical protein
MSKANYKAIGAFAASVALIGSSLIIGQAATAATTVTNSWSFNETTAGDSAVDSVGANNGVAVGNPTPSTDVPYSNNSNTGSMQFDGSNYYVVSNSLGSDFSICAWIKTSSSGGTNHWENAPIADSEIGGLAYDFGFGINSSGFLSFGNGGDIPNAGTGDATVTGNKVVNDNAWHHVCVSRNNSSGEDVLYVDGTQDTVGNTGTGLVIDNNQIWFGNGQDGNSQFVGNIDEVRFYTSVIAPAEVQALFDESKTAPPVVDPTDPVVLYDSKAALAETGGTFDSSLVIGAILMLVGSTALVVSKARN